MRMMVKCRVPVQDGNAAVAAHSMGEIIRDALERMKPEAAYFGLENGKRTMTAVFDLEDQRAMVPMLEPLMLRLNAELEVVPVMTADDLEAGFRALA